MNLSQKTPSQPAETPYGADRIISMYKAGSKSQEGITKLWRMSVASRTWDVKALGFWRASGVDVQESGRREPKPAPRRLHTPAGRAGGAGGAGGPTHHGLAPEAAPVLQAQHAATGLVAHSALGTHRQVSFQPLVRHGNLQTKQEHARDSPESQPGSAGHPGAEVLFLRHCFPPRAHITAPTGKETPRLMGMRAELRVQ